MCFCINALAGGSFGAPETYTEQYKKNYPSPAVLPLPDEASRTELEGYSPFFCFEYDQKVEDLYPDSEARSKSEKQQDKAAFWQFMESNLELPISKSKVRPDALMALPIAAECAIGLVGQAIDGYAAMDQNEKMDAQRRLVTTVKVLAPTCALHTGARTLTGSAWYLMSRVRLRLICRTIRWQGDTGSSLLSRS